MATVAIDTFITDASRIITNCAAASVTSTAFAAVACALGAVVSVIAIPPRAAGSGALHAGCPGTADVAPCGDRRAAEPGQEPQEVLSCVKSSDDVVPTFAMAVPMSCRFWETLLLLWSDTADCRSLTEVWTASTWGL